MITVSSWPYQRTDCQYIHRLFENMSEAADESIEVEEYRPGGSLRSSPDVLHLHWPETALDHRFYPRALLRAIVVLVDILVFRVRGATVVWTRHDDGSHQQTHPRTERFFVGLYQRLTDGFVHLTEGSASHFESKRSVPETVIGHGIGPIGSVDNVARTTAKQALGLADKPVIGIVGRLQAYKNVTEVIDAFAEVNDGQLLIAGNPIDDDYRSALEQRRGIDGLTLKLGRLSEDEFSTCIAACDVVVLAYRNHLNSGVAFEALATPTRIAVSESPSTGELVERFGNDWVRLVSTPDAALIADLLDWAAEPAPEQGAVVDDWAEVAQQTVGFYRVCMAGE